MVVWRAKVRYSDKFNNNLQEQATDEKI